jgi:hypothetical protein
MAKAKTNISGMSEDMSKSISKAIDHESKSVILPLSGKRIGISVSGSDESKQLGFSVTHQKDITIELTRYLLVNGAQLVYGGDLRKDGYTYAFSELSFQYRQKNEYDKKHFVNYFGWPIYNKLQNSDEADFRKNRVEIIKVPPPKEVPDKLKDKFVPYEKLENKLLWAKSMSLMRAKMIEHSDARIISGGSLSNYKGFYPGIIEEAYLTLQVKQPIFISGAFGGASGLIIRAIKGESEKKLVNEVFNWNPDLKELHKQYGEKELSKQLNNMFAAFRTLGISGLGKLNGLNEMQNGTLFNTLHLHEMIYHILIGLNGKLQKNNK